MSARLKPAPGYRWPDPVIEYEAETVGGRFVHAAERLSTVLAACDLVIDHDGEDCHVYVVRMGRAEYIGTRGVGTGGRHTWAADPALETPPPTAADFI